MIFALEGIDGAGKTTQFLKLVGHIEKLPTEEKNKFLMFREPGGTALGERIRSLLLDPILQSSPRAKLFAFMACRAQLLDEQILPAINQGKIIILDRFYLSTFAYQISGEEMEPISEYFDMLTKMINLCINETKVHFIFLDLSLEESLIRRKARGGSLDAFEGRGLNFLKKVNEGYCEILEHLRDPVSRINANQSEELVFKNVLQVMRKQGIQI